MEEQIRIRYNDTILTEAQKRYAIDAGCCKLLDGFESFIYEYQRDGQEFILRIGHSIRRNINMVSGEVDWINYLATGGVGVSRAIESTDGNLVEQINDSHGGHFLCTAFTKAHGIPPRKFGWSPDLFRTYGRMLGQMHVLSTKYEPRQPEWRRLEWDDPEMLDVERWLPDDDNAVRDRYRELTTYLNTLPKTRDTYGLIHQDAHGGNMFVDDRGQITLFDFDDCTYSWYANDIAIVLFYMITNHDDPEGLTGEFMQHFLTGYREHFTLSPDSLEQFPYFLRLREVDLYAVIHRSFDVANLDDPWCLKFMTGRRKRIAAQTPYVDFDFSTLERYL